MVKFIIFYDKWCCRQKSSFRLGGYLVPYKTPLSTPPPHFINETTGSGHLWESWEKEAFSQRLLLPRGLCFCLQPFWSGPEITKAILSWKHSLSQKWILRDHIKVVTLALKVRMFSSRNLIFTHLTHTQCSLLNALLITHIPPHTHLGYHRSKDSTSKLSHVRLLETPMDCSPPGSSVHGILQARILEGVAISSPWGSSWPRDRAHISCVPGLGRQVLYPEAPGKPRSLYAGTLLPGHQSSLLPSRAAQPRAGPSPVQVHWIFLRELDWGPSPWPLPTAAWQDIKDGGHHRPPQSGLEEAEAEDETGPHSEGSTGPHHAAGSGLQKAP